MLTRLCATLVALGLAVTAVVGPATASDPDRVRGELQRNPWSGPAGTATMHGDPGSSDTTPLRGPGADPQQVENVAIPGVCPTILAGRDGMPLALCTEYADRSPSVYLLDPSTYLPLARLHLEKGAILGGVYAYVDHRDRLVTVDGSGAIVFVGHHRTGPGATWELGVDKRIPFTKALKRLCGSTECDSVVSVAPGYDGRIWFATSKGAGGYAVPRTGKVVLRQLGPTTEVIANSISTAPDGTVITTDHATYLLRATKRGTIRTLWRRTYDRGPARKPGQLSRGSGATPTLFGPRTGREYVAITDNARPRTHLLVYRTRDGSLACKLPVLSDDNSGSENSPVGWRSSVYVASTYGYPYPAGATGEADPATADFVGGMQRIDLDPTSKHGCRSVWRKRIRSSAVPRLSTSEGIIYTVTRSASLDYDLVRISPRTGKVLSRSDIGSGPTADTLQMVGTILPNGDLLQGNIAGFTVTRR